MRINACEDMPHSAILPAPIESLKNHKEAVPALRVQLALQIPDVRLDQFQLPGSFVLGRHKGRPTIRIVVTQTDTGTGFDTENLHAAD